MERITNNNNNKSETIKKAKHTGETNFECISMDFLTTEMVNQVLSHNVNCAMVAEKVPDALVFALVTWCFSLISVSYCVAHSVTSFLMSTFVIPKNVGNAL